MKWRCKRCEVIFDDSNKKCDCVTSPSPWEPIFELTNPKDVKIIKIMEIDGKWKRILE